MENVYSIHVENKDDELRYYIEFADVNHVRHIVEVDEAVFRTIEESIRKEKTLRRQERRYMELNQDVDVENQPGVSSSGNPEDYLIIQERLAELCRVLKKHTPTQRRRFLLFIMGYSYREIAELEKVTSVAVRYSVQKVLRKVRNEMNGDW